MEAPNVPVVCSCGYDGKLTSPLCPLHGEHGLGAQVDRLRDTNAKLLEALEGVAATVRVHPDDSHLGILDIGAFWDAWPNVHAAIEKANK